MRVEDFSSRHLIRMSHQQCSLLWEVVINVGNDLYSYICLSCTWRPNNLGENKDKKFKQRENWFISLRMTRIIRIATWLQEVRMGLNKRLSLKSDLYPVKLRSDVLGEYQVYFTTFYYYNFNYFLVHTTNTRYCAILRLPKQRQKNKQTHKKPKQNSTFLILKR